MSLFLSIVRLRAQHVNAMPTWNTVGAPPITAHLGFAGAIAHRLGLVLKGMAIVHHGLDHEGQRGEYGVWQPNRLRGVPLQHVPSQPKFALSDQPMALAHYEASFVIELAAREGEDEEDAFYDLQKLAGDDRRLEEFLVRNFRFAGGTIVRIGQASHANSFAAALERLPKSGSLVCDVSEEILPARDEAADALDKAIEALYPSRQQILDREAAGLPRRWLALSNLGFVCLETPRPREGARVPGRHAFAEPLLGLVEYLPLRRATSAERPPKLFWSFAHPAPDVVVAKGRSWQA